MNRDNEFYRSQQIIELLGKVMSDIHDQYPGKENTKVREMLLKPYRDCCVNLHYGRIKINQHETKVS